MQQAFWLFDSQWSMHSLTLYTDKYYSIYGTKKRNLVTHPHACTNHVVLIMQKFNPAPIQYTACWHTRCTTSTRSTTDKTHVADANHAQRVHDQVYHCRTFQWYMPADSTQQICSEPQALAGGIVGCLEAVSQPWSGSDVGKCVV